MLKLHPLLLLGMFGATTPTALLAACNDALIQQALGGLYGGGADVTVAASAAPGYCEVASGVNLIYVSEDGRFAFQGPLFDTRARVNLTEQRAALRRREMLIQERPERTFEFPAGVRPAAHEVTVVTDVDCGYCRKFHANIVAYNNAGIDVHYLIAPLGGKGSASYNKAIQAACSERPEQAITRLMSGASIDDSPDCAHSIDQQLTLARRMGASSTPSFVLPDGTLTSGFMSPDKLLQVLERAGGQE